MHVISAAGDQARHPDRQGFLHSHPWIGTALPRKLMIMSCQTKSKPLPSRFELCGESAVLTERVM